MEKSEQNIKIKRDIYPLEFRILSTFVMIILATGTIFYHIVEHLSWLDAIYFSVVTLATVGYGDIVPKTPIGKIFTIFYILTGIGTLAVFANTLVNRAYQNRLKKLEEKD